MIQHQKLIEEAKREFVNQVMTHPFIIKCKQGKASLLELKSFLIQHAIYSSYFTRYLCALMANLSTQTEVLILAESLFEELGFNKTQHDIPHYRMFHNMLETFALKLNNEKANSETLSLIQVMFDHCRNKDPSYGLGALCLGAEALVPDLYSAIIKGFNAWEVSKDQITFFHAHVECDDSYTELLQKLMINYAAWDDSKLSIMLSAGKALVDARLKFLDGISRSSGEAPEMAL